MSSLPSSVAPGAARNPFYGLVGSSAQRLPPPIIIIMRFMTARVATTALFTIALTAPSLDCVSIRANEGKDSSVSGSKSVGSTSPISSALFAPLNWTPSLVPFRSFRGNNEPSSRGGPKPSPLPSHIFPDVIAIVTLFVEREKPKRSHSVVRHSTFAPQMQQADRPRPRRRGSPLCRNALTHSPPPFFLARHFSLGRVLLEREGPGSNPSETGCIFS